MNLGKLVNYCDSMYKDSTTKCNCIECEEVCYGDCEKCLDKIHFGDDRRYNCTNIMNFYVCKYIYKYSSEIEHAFNECNLLSDKEYLNILSIGCGPCTDLVGIKNAIGAEDIDLKYVGVDLNERWRNIHEFIRDNSNEMEIDFIYDDIFNVLDKDKNIEFNVLVLQYVLSDMFKYNDDKSMRKVSAETNTVMKDNLPFAIL